MLFRSNGELPNEYTPKEDRGNFFVLVNGPPGATYDYMLDYMDEIETPPLGGARARGGRRH